MDTIVIQALKENLDELNDFIHSKLEVFNVSPKVVMEIDLAVEEIYVNIVNYAYGKESGYVQVRCGITEKPLSAIIEFLDEGIPYNPLEKVDPDITLSAEDRQIGGLGIFMVKKLMNNVEYRYEDNKNILTLKKSC